MTNETFAQQLAGYNPTVAEEKASNLQQAKQDKLNRLSPAQPTQVVGLYDADSPILSSGGTSRITGDGYYVNAPELKDSQGNLTQAGINARIQADNYAMGVKAPNFPEGDGLDPQYYEQYKAAINPAIKERQAAGDYIVTPTGDQGKYGRPLVTAASQGLEGSQTDYLLGTGHGTLKPQYVDGQVTPGFVTKRDELIDKLERDNKSYAENLIDAVQAGIGKFGAKAGDAIVDLGLRAAKTVSGLPEKEANARLKDSVLGGILGDNIDNDGNFTGLDEYKEDREYGYDPKRIQGYVKEFKDVWSDGGSSYLDKALVTLKATIHGPEALASSTGDILAVWAGPIGLASIVGGQMNEVLASRAEAKGTTDLNMDDYGIAGASAIAYGLVNKLTAGNVGLMEAKPVVLEAAKRMDVPTWKALSTQMGALVANSQVKGVGEGIEEVIQEGTEVVGSKLFTDEQDEILTKETALDLGVAGALGKAGGESANVAVAGKELPGVLKTEAQKSEAKRQVVRYEKAKVQATEENLAAIKENTTEEFTGTETEGTNVASIKTSSTSAEDFNTKLEQAKQDVLTKDSGMELDPEALQRGEVKLRLKVEKRDGETDAEAQVRAEEVFQDKAEDVKAWMDDYAKELEGSPAALKEYKSALAQMEDIKLDIDSKAEAEQNTKVAENVVEKIKQGTEVKAELAGKSLEEQTVIIKNTLVTSFTDKVEEKDGVKTRTYKGGLTEARIDQIAEEAAQRYEISGMADSGIDMELDVDARRELLGYEGKISEKRKAKGEPEVSYLEVTNDVLKAVFKTGFDTDTIASMDLGDKSNKILQRVIKKFDPEKKGTQGNLSKELAAVNTKIEDTVSKMDFKGKLGKAEDQEGNGFRLVVAAMNTINSQVVSDTEQRQSVVHKTDGQHEAHEDPTALRRNEYWASKNAVRVQIGKDYASTYGLQPNGTPEQIMKWYWDIGGVALDAMEESGVIESTEQGDMLSKVSSNTKGRHGEQLTAKVANFDVDSTSGTDIQSNDSVLLAKDTGIRLKDTDAMFNENDISKSTNSYSSADGDVIKRISKLLLPSRQLAPTLAPVEGEIRKDPSIEINGEAEAAILALREEGMKIKESPIAIWTEVKKLRDAEDGSLNKVMNKHPWVKAIVGYSDTGASLLTLNEKGTNNANIDAANNILDALDDMVTDGKSNNLYFEYQVDINSRLTLMQNTMNFQHYKPARDMLTKTETQIVSKAEHKDYFVTKVIEDLGLVDKKLSDQEQAVRYAEITEALSNPDTADAEVVSLIKAAEYMKDTGTVNFVKKIGPKSRNKTVAKFAGKPFKLVSLLEAVNDIRNAEGGDIVTNHVVEMDASASGVFITLMNIAGRMPVDVAKDVLGSLGVTFKDGEKLDLGNQVDAYRKLEKKVTEVITVDDKAEEAGVADESINEERELIETLDDLGIDARDLAKPPVMTWFYSAGAKSITRELTASIVKHVIKEAADGSTKALAHLQDVLSVEGDFTVSDAKSIKANSKEHLAIVAKYNKVGALYNANLDKAFPYVTEYKNEMKELYEFLSSNATATNGKDYFGGRIRSASAALNGVTDLSDGTSNVYKRSDLLVNMSMSDKVEAGLSDDERGGEFLSHTQMSENVSSVLPVNAHNVDAAGIIAAANDITQLGDRRTGGTGVQLVHDAKYGGVSDLVDTKDGYNEDMVSMAISYDGIENLVISMEAVVKGMERDRDKTSDVKLAADLDAKIKEFNGKIKSVRAENDPRIANKKELFGYTEVDGNVEIEAKADMYGVLDRDRLNVEGEVVIEKKKVTKPKGGKTARPKPVVPEVPKTPAEQAMESYMDNRTEEGLGSLLNVLAQEGDILGARADKALADDVRISIATPVIMKSLYKEVDSANISDTDRKAAKSRLAGLEKSGGSFAMNGSVYIGDTRVDQLTGKQYTVDGLMDTIAHEVEHAVSDAYVNEQAASSKPAIEYKMMQKLMKRLTAANTEWTALTLGSKAGKRLKYAINEGKKSEAQGIKELVAIYQGEPNVRDEFMDLVGQTAELKKGRIESMFDSIRQAIRKLLDGTMSYKEITSQIKGELDMTNVALSIEAISARSRDRGVVGRDVDLSVSKMNEIMNDYKECK